MAITPDGSTVYVVNLASNTVTPISTRTNTAGRPIPVGRNPIAVAITPDDKTVYVGTINGDSPGAVIPISTATNLARKAITVAYPNAIVFSRDGKTAYALSQQAAPFGAGQGSVAPINTATGH